jgi:hypothetical protein
LQRRPTRVWCVAVRVRFITTVWFGSAHSLKQLSNYDCTLRLDSVTMQPSDCIRDLGVLLDSHLTMRNHISLISSTCFFHLRRLRQLRHILDASTRQRLVSAFILSRLDYCNSVFAGLPSSTLAPLRRVQSAAIRFVAGLGPRDHITATLRALHWLLVEYRVKYKLGMLMRGVVFNEAPPYLTNVVVPVTSLSHRGGLRSASDGL